VLLSSRSASSTTGLVASRDLIHRSLIVASYVHEARKVIYHDKSHKGRLWDLVVKGVKPRQHIPPEVVGESRRLLDDGGPLMERLQELRNFVGFHSLPNEFRKWLRRQPPTENIMLECAPDPKRPDVVFVASAQAIADAYNDQQAREFLGLAEALARTLPYLIEAAIYGVIDEQGLNSVEFTAFDLEGFQKAVGPEGSGKSDE
jgi:hypothetical protein